MFWIWACLAPVALGTPDYEKFQEWMDQHGRHYEAEEEEFRFRVFKANVAQIRATAADNPLAKFEADEFADWTREELTSEESVEAFSTSSSEQPQFSDEVVAQASSAGDVDWVAKGAVNEAVSQGRCGTCAQFSATANIEAQWFLAGHPLIKLSEQEMIDCSSYTGPYGMGWVADVHHGLDKNADYPLANHSIKNITGCRSPCDQDKAAKSYAHIDGATCLKTYDESQYLAWLQHGPLSISVAAGALNGYRSGIIAANSTCSDPHIDHAVLIVGYGVEDGVAYWKIRNSWGPNFGEKGYFRVKFGVNCLGLKGACQAYIGKPPAGNALISVATVVV